MTGQLLTLIDVLDAAQDEQMIKNAMKSFAQSCGYEHFAYLWVEDLQVRTLNSYPEVFEMTYLSNDFSRIDPVVNAARGKTGIFAWSAEDWQARDKSELRRFRDQAIDFGIRSGTTISAQSSFGSTVMLTFSSPEPRNKAAFQLDPQTATQIMMTVHYRLKLLGARPKMRGSRLLSRREILCVIWTAKGKNADDTAALLGIRARTVEHFLAGARKKLNVNNSPQLIDVAKDLGLF